MDDEERLTFVKSEVSMMEFARHRARELSVLTRIVESVEADGGGKRVFQQLPRHMRRRAMSHNSKRVPRRLLELHKRELEKCPKKISKRPSRRFRRRPKNLLDEYNRRQRDYVWLETHIWHAKRFKMVQRWNYKIPMHPADKSWRACYHGSQRAALLQDLSYMCCIQLEGTRTVILEKLKEITSTDCGLTFASAMSYERECSCVVYKRNSYPQGAICPVRFFWRPPPSGSESCLWLWTHPAAFHELLNELSELFGLVAEKQDENCEQKKEAGKKLSPKLHDRSPVLKGDEAKVTVLKDCLVRFRLLGRWSTAILTRSLKVAEVEQTQQEDQERWWKKLNREALETHEKQKEIWDDLDRKPFSSRLPPHSVLGLTVRDPREALPLHRCKIPPEIPATVENGIEAIDVDPRDSSSWIWDEKVRDEVTLTKKTDQEMNNIRGQNLIPGTPIDLGVESSRVPVLLIQQPGTNSEVDSGWDLIIPSGWAMSFWIPLVYAGARVGGYREHRSLAREFAAPHFPDDFPDTSAGKELETREKNQLMEKYLKYPPNKRPNYVKLGISTPFSFPWQRLVNEWSSSLCQDSESEFFVLRNRRVLRQLQQVLSSQRCRSKETTSSNVIIQTLGSSQFYRALVMCSISISSRGSLAPFALICKGKRETPEAELGSQKQKDDVGCSDVEPHHRDAKKEERKALSKTKKPKKSQVSPLESEVKEKLEEKKLELLFSSPERMISGGSKPVIGFVKAGQFSFSTGKFVGTGFVALSALLEPELTNSVHVRSTHSFQYREASLAINV